MSFGVRNEDKQKSEKDSSKFSLLSYWDSDALGEKKEQYDESELLDQMGVKQGNRPILKKFESFGDDKQIGLSMSLDDLKKEDGLDVKLD